MKPAIAITFLVLISLVSIFVCSYILNEIETEWIKIPATITGAIIVIGSYVAIGYIWIEKPFK